jgi:cell fate (sporulation/competence/biofilm development) regulator YlbF (YheA/YmcA/DUF963 family)
VTEDNEAALAADSAGGASELLSLEELIKNSVEQSDKLKNDLKAQKEMFEDSFNNNPTFREHNDRVKEARKKLSSVRQEIAKQPSVATLAQKIKDMRFDLGELNKTLSGLLDDYKQLTGATQIELRDGSIMEIVSTSKLVRRSSK